MGVIPTRPQIESVRIPARPDRDVGVGPLVRVSGAGPVQQAELVIGQVEQEPPEHPGELGGTGAVVGVGGLAEPPGVVEDGEEPDDLDVRPRLSAKRRPFSSTLAQWATP